MFKYITNILFVMNIKEKRLFLFLGILIFFSLSFVSAQSVSGQSPAFKVDSFFGNLQKNEVIKLIVGDFSTGAAGASELFFIKVLVFFLLIMLVSYAVEKVPGIGDKTSVRVLISIVVSLIAIRFITREEIVNFIWLPYGVLGVFLATILPFILGFFFIESFPNRIFRKVAWSLYVVIFAGLAWFRWDSLDVDVITGGIYWYENLGTLYLIVAVLSFILIVLDNRIRAIIHKAKYADMNDIGKKNAAIQLDIKIEDLYDKMGRTTNEHHLKYLKDQVSKLENSRDRVLK